MDVILDFLIQVLVYGTMLTFIVSVLVVLLLWVTGIVSLADILGISRD